MVRREGGVFNCSASPTVFTDIFYYQNARQEAKHHTEMSSQSENEIGEYVEIRPGRKLYKRTISFSSTSELTSERIVHLLFVHGSMASSDQYDPLIGRMMNDSKNTANLEIICHLFDALGCGMSRHRRRCREVCTNSEHQGYSWDDFSEKELANDLQAIFQSIYNKLSGSSNEGSSATMYLVGHSYGTSQLLKLIHTQSQEDNVTHHVKGLILIGGALGDGPANEIARDGGHPIFRLPTFVLNCMQHSLSQNFVDAAFHESSCKLLRAASLQKSNRNSMHMCKAFYRQTRWVTSDHAQEVKLRTLVIHGENDMILPVEAGEHLAKSLPRSKWVTISDASHQVFQERPEAVCRVVLDFILESK